MDSNANEQWSTVEFCSKEKMTPVDFFALWVIKVLYLLANSFKYLIAYISVLQILPYISFNILLVPSFISELNEIFNTCFFFFFF